MKKKCPKFDELFNDFIVNDPMMKKLNDDNRELFANLSRSSGVNITTINDIDAFYATLMVEVIAVVLLLQNNVSRVETSNT